MTRNKMSEMKIFILNKCCNNEKTKRKLNNEKYHQQHLPFQPLEASQHGQQRQHQHQPWHRHRKTENFQQNESNNEKQHGISLFMVRPLLVLLVLMNVSCVACDPMPMKIHQLEAQVGSYAVFNCHIDFPFDVPIPFILHWSKDGKKIFTLYEGETVINDLFNGRLKLVTNQQQHREYGKASVNLTAIRESDQGKYHCQIIFPNRSPSIRNNGTWHQLTVQGSLIKIPPVNQTIMEGQTALFHCVKKYPDTTLQWYRQGVAIEDVPNLTNRSFLGASGSLSIDPTMMSDLGEYECKVSNSAGEVQIAKAYLNIQYKAKVIYAPPEVYLPYGQPAVLDCHFRSNPPLKNLRWEKDGLLFDSYNVPGVFYRMNGSLFFAKVDEHHAGSYTCTPYNDLGTDGPSQVISVIVLRPPIFTITPKAIYIQKLGDTVQFACEAIDRDGNNKPDIVWSRRDGNPLPSERQFKNGGNLTITNLIETDRGIYECSATNDAATVTAETELMIENLAPRPPYNLTANSTDTSITLRWQPGYLRPNLEYTVWYRLTDAPEWRTMRIPQKNIMEATIQHLLPGREYEFMVLSQDKYGDGMFSKQFRYSTQQESKVPDFGLDGINSHETNPLSTSLTPPWNLSIIKNQQGWLLHWEEPIHGAETLRFYTVRWWKEPEHFLIGTTETFDKFYQLRHLKEDGNYKIQVLATTVDGVQIPSSEFDLEIPSTRKVRALIIGSSVAIIFLLCALCAFLYVKRSCLRHLIAPRVNESGVPGEGDSIDGGDETGDSETEKDIEKIHNT